MTADTSIGTRILILGCPGSGKSRFARQLARHTALPLIHLDKLYWRPGWIEADKETWVADLTRSIDEPRWVMDGNYLGTLPIRLARADTVIILDPSHWRCLWRVLARTVRYLGQTREDMAPGCPERFDWQFVKYLWNFPHHH